MSEGTKVPDANWHQYDAKDTGRQMSAHQSRPGFLRRTFSDAWSLIKKHPVEAVGAAAVAIALSQAPFMQETNIPRAPATELSDKNDIAQTDVAKKLDAQFPADHVQTSDVIISSKANFLTEPNPNAGTVSSNDVVIGGQTVSSIKVFTVSNALEETRNGKTYEVLMNVMDKGVQTILYVEKPTVSLPFGDTPKPVTRDSNGAYQADGIPASTIEVFTVQAPSPLDATSQP
jgi:hypothetical protein